MKRYLTQVSLSLSLPSSLPASLSLSPSPPPSLSPLKSILIKQCIFFNQTVYFFTIIAIDNRRQNTIPLVLDWIIVLKT